MGCMVVVGSMAVADKAVEGSKVGVHGKQVVPDTSEVLVGQKVCIQPAY